MIRAQIDIYDIYLILYLKDLMEFKGTILHGYSASLGKSRIPIQSVQMILSNGNGTAPTFTRMIA